MQTKHRPNRLNAFHFLAFLGIAGIAVAPLLMAPLLPAHNILWFEIQNAAHFLVFFLASWLCMGVFRLHEGHSTPVPARRYWQVLIWGALLGGLTEGLQFFLPRDADAIDFLRNIAGLVAALVIYRMADLYRHQQALSLRDHLLLSLGAVAALAALASVAGWAVSYIERDNKFPLLADFEARPWPSFVTSKGGRLRWVPAPTAFTGLADGRTLEVGFYGEGWPGFEIREPFPDWRGFSSLQIAVMNPAKIDRTLHLRIDDDQYSDGYNDRYNGVFTIAPGPHLLVIDIDEIRRGPRDRPLNLAAIRTMIIFSSAEDSPFVLFFDDIRLTR